MLEQLFDSGRVWKGQAGQRACSRQAISSGYADLDADLPDAGWRRGSLNELLIDQPGTGELRVLSPLLNRLSQQPGWILWVAPPLLPFAPALRQAGVRLSQLLLVTPADPKLQLWAMEQGLRSGGCSAVLGWLDHLDASMLRRLQLAAEEGDCFGFLLRSGSAAANASCAHLRMQLAPAARGSCLTLLKRRGGWPLPPRMADLGFQRLISGASTVAGLKPAGDNRRPQQSASVPTQR